MTYEHCSPQPAAATGHANRRALAVVAGAASYERLAKVKAACDPTNQLLPPKPQRGAGRLNASRPITPCP
jgi:hypothetical protein